jgi:hypothetical protein
MFFIGKKRRDIRVELKSNGDNLGIGWIKNNMIRYRY